MVDYLNEEYVGEGSTQEGGLLGGSPSLLAPSASSRWTAMALPFPTTAFGAPGETEKLRNAPENDQGVGDISTDNGAFGSLAKLHCSQG